MELAQYKLHLITMSQNIPQFQGIGCNSTLAILLETEAGHSFASEFSQLKRIYLVVCSMSLHLARGALMGVFPYGVKKGIPFCLVATRAND